MGDIYSFMHKSTSYQCFCMTDRALPPLLWLSTIRWCCCTTQFLEILFEPFETIFWSMFAHDSSSQLINNVLHLTSISELDVYKMRETMKEWWDLSVPKLDSTKIGPYQNGPMIILLEGLIDLASSHNCVIESTQHPMITFKLIRFRTIGIGFKCGIVTSCYFKRWQWWCHPLLMAMTVFEGTYCGKHKSIK